MHVAIQMDMQNVLLSGKNKKQNEAYDIIYLCKLKILSAQKIHIL